MASLSAGSGGTAVEEDMDAVVETGEGGGDESMEEWAVVGSVVGADLRLRGAAARRRFFFFFAGPATLASRELKCLLACSSSLATCC